MRFLWALLVFLPYFVESAQAEEGCPPGQIPAQAGGNMTSCGPIPQGYYQQSQPEPPRPTGEWIKTWGAIAVGSINSTTNYGVPTGKLSKSEAEEDAIRRCSSHGETNCKVIFTYQNQCAVIVEPHINGKPFSTGFVRAVGRATIPEASSAAIKICTEDNKNTPQAKCEIVYSACSKPIFNKY